jgi:hypothetical protein
LFRAKGRTDACPGSFPKNSNHSLVAILKLQKGRDRTFLLHEEADILVNAPNDYCG